LAAAGLRRPGGRGLSGGARRYRGSLRLVPASFRRFAVYAPGFRFNVFIVYRDAKVKGYAFDELSICYDLFGVVHGLAPLFLPVLTRPGD